LISIFNNDLGLVLDQDQGARIISLQWRDMEFVSPFNGDIKGWGWYAMAPWAGRIKDGVIKDSKGMSYQLPTTYDHPNAIDGYGFHSSWQDLGSGRQLLEFPEPYKGATVIQHFEILDNALRWSLEYEANGCDLPVTLGFHPWFAREIGKGDSAELLFAANKMFKRGDDYLPTGEIISPTQPPWDDTFMEIKGVPEIVWPGAARLTMECDTPYCMVYSQDDEGICIEPVTAPPDAQNLGIKGETYIECLITFNEDY